MVASWPAFSCSDPVAEAEISSVMRLVTEVRRFRSDQGLRPGQRVAARLTGIEGTSLAGHEDRIRALLRLEPPADGFAPSAGLAAEGITVELDLAGVIDVAAERRRIAKDLAAARAEAEQAERKLANSEFTAKAPEQVVAKTRRRLETAREDIARLEQRLAAVGG
jgi:valyl-tRNA synthetase